MTIRGFFYIELARRIEGVKTGVAAGLEPPAHRKDAVISELSP
jgi:hypothetical protein